MFETPASGHVRDPIGDWVLRAGIALAFVFFGFEKFPSGPGSPWIHFFNQVGIGQWFRYFTGIVEVAAGAMVLFPPMTRIGAALLAVTMAVASLIHIFVIHQPANALITGPLCLGLFAFWWRMRGITVLETRT